ncbi:flagellar biosynthetic protein FliQ [Microbacterium foliorum]|uniref:Flagellar biosynthetic protein FliQ n=1 Tax=Microbacterium foliorum TaxID=104336 RepID=A0A0F0KZI8_9MICO|nr:MULTISPECIES: flagellar biosynthesis protein FliQ [Microbacterium]AXL12278.1 flagellar biosynthetic protein FliQ [Microbacterium foliorum]KAA0960848.1 flagellar biosynthesis protein FliQ [Microbacterium sp. ANT_H45B]KJL24701.1 Flagellar biosynthetic protein FliQ [Microbacterium foliorum]KQZ25040.1 flagellar biosynthetic protein FliQ [Microbacterium sp. Root553]MCP1430081.1 flagellar biosynthetic protein FliQ [Microbacterium foliorum]
MNPEAVIDIGQAALIVGAKLCAPMLITALVVGFAISLLQSITQVQEMTISFVPKLVAVGIALLVSGHWMIAEMIAFTNEMFARIPTLLNGG